MPLKKIRRPATKEKCRKNISKNIAFLMEEGRPQKQAVAIALATARKAGCRIKDTRGRAGGGPQEGEFVLIYGGSGSKGFAVSKPFALEGMVITEARALSRPGSFGGEVTVAQKREGRMVEIGRARRGTFTPSGVRGWIHYGNERHGPMQTVRFAGSAAELEKALRDARRDGTPARFQAETEGRAAGASYKTNDPRGWGGDPKRGAALGRPSVRGEVTFAGRLTLRRIRLDQGGYDPNGTYFGLGAPLYWYASDDGSIDDMLRAGTRESAKKQILARYPAAKFYR